MMVLTLALSVSSGYRVFTGEKQNAAMRLVANAGGLLQFIVGKKIGTTENMGAKD